MARLRFHMKNEGATGSRKLSLYPPLVDVNLHEIRVVLHSWRRPMLLPCWAPAPLEISGPRLLSMVKLAPRQFHLQHPYCVYVIYDSHLLKQLAVYCLYPAVCASIFSRASAFLRSLQSCRLHCLLNELEARFLPNSIVFGLSILALWHC
jgi:hypothetical protein